MRKELIYLKEKRSRKKPKKIAQDEEKEVDYEVLDKKYPIIDWKTQNYGTKPQLDESKRSEEINLNVVIRSNGQKRFFSTLMSVLSVFDREDLDAVYKLVMDIYQDKIPDGFDKVLWGDLTVMFNPDEQDEFWNSQHEWKVISWKLHSSSGVHTLMTNEGVVIHMLTEKKYPLKKEILSWLVQDQTVLGKDKSNLLIADSLLKTIWFINAPCYDNEALASPNSNDEELSIPEQTATGKGTSNPLMAGSLPKTTKPTELPAKVNKARGAMIHLIMSSATSVVTYTSVYTNSEPGRAFWGANNRGGLEREAFKGHLTRIRRTPLTASSSQPITILNNSPEKHKPIYPEYIPLEDEHEFPLRSSHYLLLIHLLLSHPDMLLSRILEDPEEVPGLMRQRMDRRTVLLQPSTGHTLRLGERLARCTAPPAHSPPLPPSSRVVYGLAAGRFIMGDRMNLYRETIWMVEEKYVSERLGLTRRMCQATHQELKTIVICVCTRDYLQALPDTATADRVTLIQWGGEGGTNIIRRQEQMVETLQVIRDMRREMSDMQTELLALREQQRRARQPGPEARCQITGCFWGRLSVTSSNLCYCILLIQYQLLCIEKSCKSLPPALCFGAALTWWIWSDKNLRQSDNKRKADVSSRKKSMVTQHPLQRQSVAKVFNRADMAKGSPYGGLWPKCNSAISPQWHVQPSGAQVQQDREGFALDCRNTGHFKRDCPKLKNKDRGNGNAQGWVYVVGNAEKRGNCTGKP
ncbi:hypothetical protein Tco_0989551 [Tanacetum coccineum]|uniref:CCHC-type domain-containing protein n=1 Tax=Tanacetum coccineum TaxID=301880 RepID=A0ABQ5EUC5_9ASTR